MPWWQEVAPLVVAARDAFGVQVTVLRILETSGPYPGGRVTYLVEAPDIDPALLSPTSVDLPPDPNRAHYAEVGAPGRLVEWATARLEEASIDVTGRPSQDRSWNLAATWTIPTSSGRVWLKATPPFLEHEAAVLEVLQPTRLVPRLIAGEPGRVLMHDVAGIDGYGIGGQVMQGAVDVLLELQEDVDGSSVPSLPLLGAGELTDRVDGLIESLAPLLDPDDRSRLSALRNELTDRFGAVASCGEVLVHGDFHGGNIRLRNSNRPVVLDWGDSFVGSPLFDVFALENYAVEGSDGIRRHWLDRLGASDEQWSAFRPVAALLLPLVYLSFCDNIEAAELAYHQNDILPALQTSLSTV